MNKPLTVEELKVLPRGFWIWFVSCEANIGHYECIKEIQKDKIVFENNFTAHFREYGDTWCAYKSEEDRKLFLKKHNILLD